MTVLLEIREDLEYHEDSFVQQLEAKGIKHPEAVNVWHEFFRFVHEDLSKFIRVLCAYIYEDLEIEASPPSANDVRNTVSLGEWVGVYRFYSDSLGSEVELRVVPKVGTVYFFQMLNDISGLVTMLGYPAMNVVWFNTYGYSHIRNCVSYSGMLEQMTELTMSEGFPPITTPREIVSDGAVGHINRSRTLMFLSEGAPFAVVKRQEISYPKLPLMVFAKFHATIGRALLQLLNDVQSDLIPELKPLENMLMDRIRYHSYILTTDIVRALVDMAYATDLESIEILEKAKEQVGKSRWLRDIIDLYQSYVFRRPLAFDLLERWRRNVPLQPIPSSKVYELWILTLFSSIFMDRLRTHPTIRERDGGFEFDFDAAEIQYNVARADWSKLFSRITRAPRPDFMLANGGRRAVADAKYREPRRLNVEDVERIIAYIIDYSEPQDHEEIKGFLITLGEGQLHGVIERTDITPNIRIHHLSADPRQRDAALSALEKVYSKIFK